MPTITNFHPIKAINSLLQPLGLTLSNKQQVINKVAIAALAMLVVTCGLATVEAQSGTIWDVNRSEDLQDCLYMCNQIQEDSSLRNRCRQACANRFPNQSCSAYWC